MSRQWYHYQQNCLTAPELGFYLDVSRVRFPEHYRAQMHGAASSAMNAMAALEAGAIANPDEARMVGHYWLRAPDLGPEEFRAPIRDGQVSVTAFAEHVRKGVVRGANGPFTHLIHVGIGGSANGPQLICGSQHAEPDGISVRFIDNADPDCIATLLHDPAIDLGRTLVSIVSKSGWTPTPWRVMVEFERIYAANGLDFARHAVATTMTGTRLFDRASAHRWLACFPLWDWVGGRTSVTSAVGLLPAALQGMRADDFLRGAAAMDELTRRRDARLNPAMTLALTWHWLGSGHGGKSMVILPYRDRLVGLPRYVQQLVMESIGKRLDRSGNIVHQGLTVYGHKGVTDQHAYVQQLIEGRDDSFVTFVLAGFGEESTAAGFPTLADHLFANFEGTRDTLSACGRDSVTISVPDAGPTALGALVALFERAVGLYAELIDVNAYHQPSVNKDVAAPILALQSAAVGYLGEATAPLTAAEVARGIGHSERTETVYKILRRLSAQATSGIRELPDGEPFGGRFAYRG